MDTYIILHNDSGRSEGIRSNVENIKAESNVENFKLVLDRLVYLCYIVIVIVTIKEDA